MEDGPGVRGAVKPVTAEDVRKAVARSKRVALLGTVLYLLLFVASFTASIFTGIRTAVWRLRHQPGSRTAPTSDHFAGHLDACMYAFFLRLLFVSGFTAAGQVLLYRGLLKEVKAAFLVGAILKVGGGFFIFTSLSNLYHDVTLVWMDYNNNPGPNQSYNLLVSLIIVLPILFLFIVPIEVYQWYVLLHHHEVVTSAVCKEGQDSSDASTRRIDASLELTPRPFTRYAPTSKTNYNAKSRQAPHGKL